MKKELPQGGSFFLFYSQVFCYKFIVFLPLCCNAAFQTSEITRGKNSLIYIKVVAQAELMRSLIVDF